LHKLSASLLLISLVSPQVSAREVDRAEVAEDFARDVPQEQRVFCSDTQIVTLTDGTQRRACMNWRAENKTRLMRLYASLEGPETDSPENLAIARDCFDLAVASQNDPDRISFDQDRFLAGARQQFAQCAAARPFASADQYSLTLYDRGVWLGGS
jgi:hypothetical protein